MMYSTMGRAAAGSTVVPVLVLAAVAALFMGCQPQPGEFVSVPAGAFEMGRPYEDGSLDEIPVHEVYLDAYAIGKYPVTNQEYADVLNWAHAQGRLTNEDGGAYTGGLIYAHGQPLAETAESVEDRSQIVYSGEDFSVRSLEGHNGQMFSMADHPTVMVSWYGAVAYANWLSEMHGLDPCYDFETWARFEPVRDGYRLPTEAEWERAAAWDAAQQRHWRYGFSSDTIDFTRANYWDGVNANPLRLTSRPPTSPVGWYDGSNLARLDEPEVWTQDSRSPVGAYDMSGNVREWCHDWHSSHLYSDRASEGVADNPTGALTGASRVLRGSSWFYNDWHARAAARSWNSPRTRHSDSGFRLCVSDSPG